MKYIRIFEKFSESDYSEAKKKREQKGIQKLGDKFIVDIIENGDFDGLNYLLSTGYNLQDSTLDENLITKAVISNQLEMLDYLLENNYASDWENAINSIAISDIIGQKNYNEPNIITPEMIEALKTITKYGYEFESDGRHNYFEMYLSENKGWVGKDENGQSIFDIKILKGAEPFIDWLLENYPDNYRLCKNFTDIYKVN